MTPSVATPNRALVEFASERGIPLSRSTAKDLRKRKGDLAARERIKQAERLMDFASIELGIELSYPSASKRLGRAADDLATAIDRMRSQAASQQVHAFAERHGVQVGLGTTALGREAPSTSDLQDLVVSVARVLDVASELQLPITTRGAWIRAARCNGDVEIAITKLRRDAERRRRRASHYCRAGGLMRSRSVEACINQAARCGCRRCVDFLLRELERYTSSITRFERPLPLKDQDDVRQEAGVALVHALDDWEGAGSFKAYYGTVLTNHLASLHRWFATQGRGGEQPLSLDADAFAGHEGGRVALIDTVPDRCLDTATIVMIRESIFEYLAAIDDASRRACIAYEARGLVV